jgi:hypothetical protein
MNWIYDKRTEHSRLMVAIDRNGITVRQWSEGEEKPFHFDEGFFSWNDYHQRDRNYSGDDGSGNMQNRLVAGAISLLGHWGPSSSDCCGDVDSLDEYKNGSHTFTC